MTVRVLATLFALMSLGALAMPAQAEENARSRYQLTAQDVTALDFFDRFQNMRTGQYLDDSWEYGLRALPNYNNDHQLWNVHLWADDTYELKNVVTGRCIDDSFEYGLRTVQCYANDHQSWYLILWTDGRITWQNQKTKRAIDHSWEYGLRAFPLNYGEFQRW